MNLSPALALALSLSIAVLAPLACSGGPGDTDETAGDSSSSTAASTGDATTGGSTGGSTTAGSDGSGTATGTSTTNTTEMTSTSTASTTSTTSTTNTTEMTSTSNTTEMTSTSTTNTSSTTEMTSSGTTGDLCSGETESCAKGEKCCDGLQCCAGVPVPEGEEFCAEMCPISDRNLKRDLRAIDPAEVLARVVALPITSWRYTKDGPEVRHLGPMAQDFAAAFGLGASDRLIFPLDEGGVSLAAIQGLHARLVAAEEENAALRRRLGALEERLARIEGSRP